MVCGMGSCGAGQVSRTLEFESDGSVIGTHEECFEYVETDDGMGARGRICKTRSADSASCSVSVNGTMCSSCEIKTCDGDSTKQEYLADCTNLEGGQLFDFCEQIKVVDNSTAFVWLDDKFEEDISQCSRSLVHRVRAAALVSGSVLLLLLS